MEELLQSENEIKQSSSSLSEVNSAEISESYFTLLQQVDELDLSLYQKQEITSPQVLKQVNKLIGDGTKNGQKLFQNQHLKGQELFKLNVPLAELYKIKGADNQYRALVKGADNKIIKHAVLTPVQAELAKGAKAAAAVANAMEVGSLVVGQYYMAEISKQLSSMQGTLQAIKDFQDDELKASIRSLIPSVSQIAQFSSEYFENDEFRRLKQGELGQYRTKAIKLLEQVNIAIERITKNSKQISFDEYEKLLRELHQKLAYQAVLLKLLAEISRLELVFAKGQVSHNSIYSVYNHYLADCNRVSQQLSTWHKDKIKKFKIEPNKRRREQEGLLKNVADVADAMCKNEFMADGFKFIRGAFTGPLEGVGKMTDELDKALHYIEVSKETLKLLSDQQSQSYKAAYKLEQSHYDKNVELLVEGERIYYLLPTENS